MLALLLAGAFLTISGAVGMEIFGLRLRARFRLADLPRPEDISYWLRVYGESRADIDDRRGGR
jgi:hypothetical protein